jgi:hypothetical protein
MWSEVERFLCSEGFAEGEVAHILEVARAQGLDASLINRVIAIDEREQVVSLH